MNNYKILVSGIGIEAFLFLLPDEKSETLSQLDLTLPFSQIAEALEIEDLGAADTCLRGVWLDSISFSVSLDSRLIWSAYTPPCELDPFDSHFEDQLVLSHQNNISGDLLIFELQSEQFEPERLCLSVTHIGGRTLVTTLIYGGEYLDSPDEYLEWECDWSQNFIISDLASE